MAQTDEKTSQAVPAKCVHCSRPMKAPVFCDFCEQLNPLTGVADHFQLLGLPRRFDIDGAALHESFVALSRHAHPDFHVDDPPEVQALSMSVSSQVNEAHRTLSDPVRRAAYLLELLGGPSSAADRSVPDGFLETTMMMQEEVQDALEADDGEAACRLAGVLRTQHDGLMRRVADLFAKLDEAIACEATRLDSLGQIRRQLNAVAYVKKLMSMLEGPGGKRRED